MEPTASPRPNRTSIQGTYAFVSGSGIFELHVQREYSDGDGCIRHDLDMTPRARSTMASRPGSLTCGQGSRPRQRCGTKVRPSDFDNTTVKSGAGNDEAGNPAAGPHARPAHRSRSLVRPVRPCPITTRTVTCDTSKGSIDRPRASAFTRGYGDEITCTITNSAQARRSRSSRTLVPQRDTGTFDLKIDAHDVQQRRRRLRR